MPIRRRSGADMRRWPTLALGLGALASSAVIHARQPGDASTAAGGDAAVERLKRAVKTRDADVRSAHPAEVPRPSPEMTRRAFDALRGRRASPTADARTRAALEQARAAVARERDAMARRLHQALGLDAPDAGALARAALPASGTSNWVPVLFVSSSMPVGVLRTYAAQLEKARGVLAFRGMPGGLRAVAPMARLSAEILRLDPGCEGPACAMRNVQLIVDPILFRQHGIARVPALAMIPGDPTQPYCERDETSPRAPHIIFGDAALSGLLDEHARLGGKEEVRDARFRLDPR